MTKSEKGAYLDLILYQFDKGIIPQKIIDRVAGEDWPGIADKFEEVQPGFFANETMAEVRESTFKTYFKRLESFETNFGKESEPRMGDRMGDRTYSLSSLSNSKSNSLSKSKSKSKDSGNSETAPLVFPWTDEGFLSTWQLWKDYKKEQFKFDYKPRGEQSALKNLSELASDWETAVRIIHRSMGNGWKGLFALGEKEQKADYQKKAGEWASDILKKHGVI